MQLDALLRTGRLANGSIQLGDILAHILQGSFQTGSLCRSGLLCRSRLTGRLAFHRLGFLHLEEAAASVFAARILSSGSAFDSTLDSAGASDTASLTAEAPSKQLPIQLHFPAQTLLTLQTKRPPTPQRTPFPMQTLLQMKHSFPFLPHSQMPEASRRKEHNRHLITCFHFVLSFFLFFQSAREQ